MFLKAQEIYNMRDSIAALSQQKIPMPSAYYIAKNMKLIKKEVGSIEEAREKLLTEFGDKKEDGSLDIQDNGMLRISDEKLPAFNEELNKLFNAEIEINMNKIPLSQLSNIDLSTQMIETLIPIIEDDSICNDCDK